MTPDGDKSAKPSGPGIEALLKYIESPSSAVRLKAVRELTSIPDARATAALEERIVKDTSVQVRLAAIKGLETRNSVSSIPVLRRAAMTTSNTNERAAIYRVIRHLTGTDTVKDEKPQVYY